MSRDGTLYHEKLGQVPGILDELGLDAWMLFARESATVHDPSFDLVVGTNVTWHSAFLLTRSGDRIAVVGSLDAENVRAGGLYPEIVTYVGGISAVLRDVLARLDPRRIAIDYSVDDPAADGITHGQWLALVKCLEGTPYGSRLESADRLVAALRGRKTVLEQRLIREACEATVGIFEAVTPRLRPGLTEKQFAALIVGEMKRAGLTPAWDAEQCPAVFTGPDSAGAHAGPTDRPIEPGHIVNVDFGVRKDGFCSDLQRTWYVLRPGETEAPPPVKKGFDTILASIRKAAAAIEPGKTGAEIDDVARGVVTSAGYDEYPHGTGHQIGRVAHDGGGGLMPRWERYGNTPFLPIEVGQCFTIEPRLTVAGHGIATCEDIVVVTERGAEFLSRSQDRLWLVGAV
ncbi:MAG TPA: M24 family metallopeptidase [Candidatus Polarisedimenticolaceae bacterium]|nr:M24 family metallopeptidase [Candidatus Polarisedimenticolaceae bacterium]